MSLPDHPVTLTVEQVTELCQKLADMRHNVNNQLSLISAAVEVMNMNPQAATRMLAAVQDQPTRIIEEIRKFSTEFDRLIKGVKPPPSKAL